MHLSLWRDQRRCCVLCSHCRGRGCPLVMYMVFKVRAAEILHSTFKISVRHLFLIFPFELDSVSWLWLLTVFFLCFNFLFVFPLFFDGCIFGQLFLADYMYFDSWIWFFFFFHILLTCSVQIRQFLLMWCQSWIVDIITALISFSCQSMKASRGIGMIL